MISSLLLWKTRRGQIGMAPLSMEGRQERVAEMEGREEEEKEAEREWMGGRDGYISVS